LSVGDELKFGDKSFTVAEVRGIGNVLVTQFAFITLESFREIFSVSSSVNYVLVKAQDGVFIGKPHPVARATGTRVLGLHHRTVRGTGQREGDRRFPADHPSDLVISFIVSLAVLSLVIYSATIERAREYAIMKVIGASPMGLYRIVLSQSIFIAVVGFGAGVGLAARCSSGRRAPLCAQYRRN
jgi:putative ABC transport system permease protein